MLFLLLLTSLTALSSSSLILVWVIMEVNLLSFIGVLASTALPPPLSPLVTYYVSQSFCSLALFYLIVSQSTTTGAYNFTSLVITMKMGLIPFHQWYMLMITTLEWKTIWLLSTAQKLIPTYFLSFIPWNTTTLGIVVLSAMGSSVLMFYHKETKIIFMFSSIFIMAWTLASLAVSLNFWLLFLISYGMPLKPITMLMENHTRSLQITYSAGPTLNQTEFLLGMMMISGIPPFLMFFMKILLVSWLIVLLPLMTVILILSSVLMIYNYMQIFYLTLLAHLSHNLSTPMSVSPPWPYSSLLIFLTLLMVLH